MKLNKDEIAVISLPGLACCSTIVSFVLNGPYAALVAIACVAALCVWLLWPERETEHEKLLRRVQELEARFAEIQSNLTLHNIG